MTVSAMFGVRIVPTPFHGGATVVRDLKTLVATGGATSVIECSSRPQKKSTAHHMKSRPKKTQAWDIRRGPTVYAPLPPLPPEWTLVTPAPAEDVSSTPQPAEVAVAEQA